MGVLGAVKVDQRRRETGGLFAGEAVHQFGKKGFPHAGWAGQQHVQTLRIEHGGAAFFNRIAQAAVIANQAGERIVVARIFRLRKQVSHRAHLALATLQFAPQQCLQRLAVQEEHRTPPAFNRQTVIPQLVEIFTDRVARQPQVEANRLRGECRLLRQIGTIQPTRQPFKLSQYDLDPSHLFTA